MGTVWAGIGTILSMAPISSPTNFAAIAQVGDITGPTMTAGTYDSTSHDTTGGYKTFITGLKDAGEVGFKLFFDPAAATHKDATGGLVDAYKNNLVNYWKIAMGNVSPAANWTFRGVITKIDFAYPVDGPQTAQVTIKISGASVLA